MNMGGKTGQVERGPHLVMYGVVRRMGCVLMIECTYSERTARRAKPKMHEAAFGSVGLGTSMARSNGQCVLS
jgi:hypothetical protein